MVIASVHLRAALVGVPGLGMLAAGCAAKFPAGGIVRMPVACECSWAAEPVIVDGLLNDPAWRAAQPVRAFATWKTGEFPIHRTRAWLLWDARHLYVAFDASDPDVRGVRDRHDSDTYRDDVLEVFLAPGPPGGSRYTFEINPLGTVRDERHAAGAAYQAEWNCEGLRAATKVLGTLNHPDDRDEGWRLEIAIPFASLAGTGGKAPEPGDGWRFHLARGDRSRGLPDGKEWSTCAPLRGASFHDSRHWIGLTFTAPEEAYRP